MEKDFRDTLRKRLMKRTKEKIEEEIKGEDYQISSAIKLIEDLDEVINLFLVHSKEKYIEYFPSIKEELSRLKKERENFEKFLDDVMQKYCPNIKAVAGTLIGAKLINIGHGLKRLATLPSSTIQVLGAEKALFQHLRTGAKPPKYGVIFQHPLLKQLQPWNRGKMARTLAAKLSIAAKEDYFGEGKMIAEDLLKSLENRSEQLKKQKQKEKKPFEQQRKGFERQGHFGKPRESFEHRERNFSRPKEGFEQKGRRWEERKPREEFRRPQESFDRERSFERPREGFEHRDRQGDRNRPRESFDRQGQFSRSKEGFDHKARERTNVPGGMNRGRQGESKKPFDRRDRDKRNKRKFGRDNRFKDFKSNRDKRY